MITRSAASVGGSGSRMIGSPARPTSPEKTSRDTVDPSVASSTTDAEPRMCPASMYRARIPSQTSNHSPYAWRRISSSTLRASRIHTAAAPPDGHAPGRNVEVVFLDARAIREHDGRQIRRRLCGVDDVAVAVRGQKRQPSRMIEMRVRQHDRIDLVDWTGQCAILRVSIAAPSLEQPAVQQDRFAVRAHDVARARDLASGSGELDFHPGISVAQIDVGTAGEPPSERRISDRDGRRRAVAYCAPGRRVPQWLRISRGRSRSASRFA